MSFHDDMAGWLEMSDPRRCPVCQDRPMEAGLVDVVERPCSWLNARPVDCLRGACHVIAKQHAVELYDLDEAGLLGLMKEVQQYARALKQVTGAVKINYEIHGNSVPHLHIHLYPRCPDDPFPGRPIDYRRQVDQYPDGGFEAFVAALQEALQAW